MHAAVAAARAPDAAEEIVMALDPQLRPEELKKNEPHFWSPGNGADVWEMFCAAAAADLETIQRLLDRDPSLVRSAYDYRTPLSFAVRENQLEVAAFLLERGADPVNSGNPDTLLAIARDRGYLEMQKLLEGALAGGRGGAVTGGAVAGEAVAAAIRERDLPKVRRLLDASPELVHVPDERTHQPIHWAVMTRQLDVIDELLRRGADIIARPGIFSLAYRSSHRLHSPRMPMFASAR